MTLQDEVTITVVDPPIFSYDSPFSKRINVDIGTIAPTVISNNYGGTMDYWIIDPDTGSSYSSAEECPAGLFPTGLSFDWTTGEITGIPTELGTYTFNIGGEEDVTWSYSVATVVFAIKNVARAKAPTNPPPETPEVPETPTLYYSSRYCIYQESMAPLTPELKNLTAPYLFSVTSGELPEDLEINSDTGVISGIPRSIGSTKLTVEVTDNAAQSATSSFAIYVDSDDVPEPDVPQPPDYWEEPYVPGGSGISLWATVPKVDIRPLTRTYMQFDEPILVYGRPQDIEINATSDESVYEVDQNGSWLNPGESMPDQSNPYWEWSANSLLPEVDNNTTDTDVLEYTPLGVTEWDTVDSSNTKWKATVGSKPKQAYHNYINTDDEQRIERLILFNNAAQTEHSVIDLKRAVSHLTVFLVGHINPNSIQDTHVLFDTDYSNNTEDVTNRAAIVIHKDRMVCTTEFVSDVMKAKRKIIVPQEYSVSWRTDKPVVYYARFSGEMSRAGYYVPGRDYCRKGTVSDLNMDFRYLALGRPYNASTEDMNAEMSLYGVVIVPNFMGNTSMLTMCKALSSKYNLEELWR